MELGNLVLCNSLWVVDVVPVAVNLGNFIYSVIATDTIDRSIDTKRLDRKRFCKRFNE